MELIISTFRLSPHLSSAEKSRSLKFYLVLPNGDISEDSSFILQHSFTINRGLKSPGNYAVLPVCVSKIT